MNDGLIDCDVCGTRHEPPKCDRKQITDDVNKLRRGK